MPIPLALTCKREINEYPDSLRPTTPTLTLRGTHHLDLAEIKPGRGRKHHRSLLPVALLQCISEKLRACHGVEGSLPWLKPCRPGQSCRRRGRRTLAKCNPYCFSSEHVSVSHVGAIHEHCADTIVETSYPTVGEIQAARVKRVVRVYSSPRMETRVGELGVCFRRLPMGCACLHKTSSNGGVDCELATKRRCSILVKRQRQGACRQEARTLKALAQSAKRFLPAPDVMSLSTGKYVTVYRQVTLQKSIQTSSRLRKTHKHIEHVLPIYIPLLTSPER